MDKREYLFKGKRIDGMGWVYGSYVNRHRRHGIITQDVLYFDFQIDPETVCQFSGLPDMMGDKIFDGDILNYEGELLTVFYDLKEAGYAVRHPDGAEHYLEEIASESVITGNIHD